MSVPASIQTAQVDTFFDKKICHCYLVFSVCAELFVFPQQVKSKPYDEIANVRLIFKAALPQIKQNIY